jgi:hypothetical protein
MKVANIAHDSWMKRVVEKAQNDSCEAEFKAGVDVGFRAAQEIIARDLESQATWFCGRYMTAIDMDKWLSWYANRVRELGEEVTNEDNEEVKEEDDNKA